MMEKSKMVLIVFQIIASGIFLYQVKNSVERYISRPVVTETSTVPRKDIDEPTFYVCEKELVNYTVAQKYGYAGQRSFLLGELGKI